MAWNAFRVSVAIAAPPSAAVEMLLVALRELARLQRSDPQRSGRLRLELSRSRRRWRLGGVTDDQFAAAVTDIVLAARGLITAG
jgi:hypothetical protein